MVDWPDDLAETIGRNYYLAHGGHEFDGREISAFDPAEIRGIAEQIKVKGLTAIAISSVFSPVNSIFEEKAAEVVKEIIPDANITLSSTIGRIGLLERENAAIMNACLRELALKTVDGFKKALRDMNISAPFFISQNDGTLMNADFAADYPVLTFASGPTNSMRGAAFLSGLKDALVVDVGGTTTDVGVLQQGFPRVAAMAVDIGGVRTNFRMPDTLSIGLGGGSLVETHPIKVGPQSVGYELISKAKVFGGDTLTTTDVIVAAGHENIGDKAKVSDLDSALLIAVEDRIAEMVNIAVDRMKTSATPMPVIVVGGGSILIRRKVEGASEMIKPKHFAVANAIGAAIAQVGGETDRIFALADMTRDEALEQAKKEAIERAVSAGAKADSVEIVDVEEVPLAYLPGNAMRIMVKAVGDLAGA
jgi:N-methylhydantoinase A/oxoprolinase/acetone carboxylase beta subunit